MPDAYVSKGGNVITYAVVMNLTDQQAENLDLSQGPVPRGLFLFRSQSPTEDFTEPHRVCHVAPFPQSVACEARHALTGPRAGRVPCAHARPAPASTSFESFVSFMISKTRWQSFSVFLCDSL